MVSLESPSAEEQHQQVEEVGEEYSGLAEIQEEGECASHTEAAASEGDGTESAPASDLQNRCDDGGATEQERAVCDQPTSTVAAGAAPKRPDKLVTG